MRHDSANGIASDKKKEKHHAGRHMVEEIDPLWRKHLDDATN